MTAPTRRAPSGPDGRHLAAVAVRYASHGWPVLPVHAPRVGGCSCTRGAECTSAGKHPRTRRGVHEASCDPDQVREWWTRWPDANIGIATGPTAGLLVVDIDLPDGPRSLAELEATHGQLPATCQQRTGSGGHQMLFAHPDRDVVGNRAALLAGIDVRGDGGYIVVPPSRHASGDRYRWTSRTAPTAAPGWLLEVIARDRTAPSPSVERPTIRLESTGATSRYATAALERELTVLAGAGEGTRNDTLNRAAFNLGQLVGAGALPAEAVTRELQQVADAIGLGPAEARRTIASGLGAGIANPRPTSAARDITRTDGSRPATAVGRALVRRR